MQWNVTFTETTQATYNALYDKKSKLASKQSMKDKITKKMREYWVIEKRVARVIIFHWKGENSLNISVSGLKPGWPISFYDYASFSGIFLSRYPPRVRASADFIARSTFPLHWKVVENKLYEPVRASRKRRWKMRFSKREREKV